MGRKQEYQPLFPEYLNHLNESYTKLQNRLAAIDYELENAPKDKGPIPAPAPPGMKMGNFEMRKDRAEFLEKMRDANVKGFKTFANKQIGYLSEKEQKTLNDRYDFETSKNGFKDYSKENLKDVRIVDKGDKISMDYMDAQYFSRYHVPEKVGAVEKQNIDQWSERFQNILDYYGEASTENFVVENDDVALEKE